MKKNFKYLTLICVLLSTLLFAACGEEGDTRPIIRVQISDINEVVVDDVKAFASLRQLSTQSKAASTTTKASNGEFNLYVVNDSNELAFPELTCTYQFGEDVSPDEQQTILEELQPRVEILSMHDIGKHVLIQAVAYFESSWTESIPQMSKIRHLVVRKSDGAVLDINDETGFLLIDFFIHNARDLYRYTCDSKGNEYFIFGESSYGKSFVKLSVNNNRLSATIEAGHTATEAEDRVLDAFDNQYEFVYPSVVMNGYRHLDLQGSCFAVSQLDNKAYAFTYSFDESLLRAYELSNGAQLIAESGVKDEHRVDFWGGSGRYVGYVDGELLWNMSKAILRYDVNAKCFSSQSISEDLLQAVSHSEWAEDAKLFEGVLYQVQNMGSYAQISKIDLLTENEEIIKVDLPQSASMTSAYFQQAYLSNKRLDIQIYYSLAQSHSQSIFLNLCGADEDESGLRFDDFELDKFIPLK